MTQTLDETALRAAITAMFEQEGSDVPSDPLRTGMAQLARAAIRAHLDALPVPDETAMLECAREVAASSLEMFGHLYLIEGLRLGKYDDDQKVRLAIDTIKEWERRKGGGVTDADIKHMVARFLTWQLPENFNPDGGISFKRDFNENSAHPMQHKPVGTNLLDAVQAEAMVRHMITGLAAAPEPASLSQPISAPPMPEFRETTAPEPAPALPADVENVVWRWRQKSRTDWEAWVFCKEKPDWLPNDRYVVERLSEAKYNDAVQAVNEYMIKSGEEGLRFEDEKNALEARNKVLEEALRLVKSMRAVERAVDTISPPEHDFEQENRRETWSKIDIEIDVALAQERET